MGSCRAAAGERFRHLTILMQLLLTYGGITAAVFLIALLILVSSVYGLRDQVLNESTAALRRQVIQNGGFILSEGADLVEARMMGGVQRLVLPTAYATYEASRSDRAYSVSPPASYPDSSAWRLKQPTELDEFNRYPCNESESQADRDLRGCLTKTDDVPFKSISSSSSAVYLRRFRLDGANVDAMMANEAPKVDVTAHMDHFVREAWRRSSMWMGAWIALGGGVPLMRIFPGYVGDLTEDNGYRTYDPTTRPFYVVHEQATASAQRIATTNEGQGRFSVTYTEPYKSLYGDGLLFTISVPVHGPTGNFMGVAGTDVKATVLADIVEGAKIRKSGQVHMYHLDSSLVAASPDWDAAGDTLMQAGQISLPFWEGHTLDEYSGCQSIDDVDTHAVIKRPALDGKYCLAAVVPGEEILRPIEAQRDDINSAADSLFLICLLVLLGCFFLLVLPCTLYMSFSLSTPLIRMSKETDTMVRNIGGDLLDGIYMSDTSKGPGEIGQLRSGFRRLLLRLKAKRDNVRVPPANPMYGKVQFREDQTRIVAGVTVTPGTPLEVDQQGDGHDGHSTRYVPLRMRLCCNLILPMVVALSCIIAFTAVQMYGRIDEWLGPVKDTMIQEELQTMTIRSGQRGQYVAEVIGSYQSMVHTVKTYAEKLYNDELPLLTPHCSYHTPQRVTNSLCSQPTLERDVRRQLRTDGASTRSVDFERLAWYRPESSTAPSSARYSGTMASMGSAVSEHQGRSAHLANVARVAYFSSDTSYVYFAFESEEVYMQYPYEELEGFYSPMANSRCSGPSEPSRYTPLCKAWYQNARSAGGAVAFSPVDINSATGFPYVSIGAAIFQNGTKLVGVAAVDVELGRLKTLLRQTPLYQTGNTYMFDADGYVIVHPDHDEMSGRARVVKVAAGGDQAFAEAYSQYVVGAHGTVGSWVYPWYNPEMDAYENWYYAFRPVNGTPYQLVMAVVDREIEAAARQLQDDLYNLTRWHIALSTVFFAIGAALLVIMTYYVQVRLVRPVMAISSLLVRAEKDKGYLTPVPSDHGVWSQELINVLGNFRRLVTALRFSNPDYHKGDRLKELDNLRAAQDILEVTANKRGQGVCLNNLGHCVRLMSPGQRSKAELKPNEGNATDNLKLAIDNARELAQGSQGPDLVVAEDSCGLRLLGLGLALLDEGDTSACFQCFKDASQMYKKNGSWQKLAQLAFTIATLAPNLRLDKLPKEVLDWAASQAEEAADLLKAKQQSEPLEAQAGTAVAQLCFARAALKSEWGLLRWCMAKLPNLDMSWVVRLAGHVKVYVPSEIAAIDAAMDGVEGWVKGEIASPSEAMKKVSAKKRLLFVLDCSHSMNGGDQSGSYLQTCKGAIRNILENFTSDEDRVGLLAFAHHSKQIFPITVCGPNRWWMAGRVSSLETFGATAFYDAVLEGVRQVARTSDDGAASNSNAGEASEAAWIVALTDGADGSSRSDSVGEARRLFEQGGVNAAFITVGSLPQSTISVIRGYVGAARAADMQALHIVASDSAKIAEAFEKIAVLMDQGPGLAEAL